MSNPLIMTCVCTSC